MTEREEPKVEQKVEKELENLEKEVQESQREIDRLTRALKELTAEYENFKRDSLRDREQLLRNANEYLLTKLIPVLDDFERVMENSQQSQSVESLRKAIEMVYKKLWNILNNEGFSKIEPKKTFDPFEHEAVEKIETNDHEEYTVLKVVENGYKYRNKVLKPIKVQVAIRPRGEESAKTE